MRCLAALMALPLLAQSQPTFYEAFEDGQGLEQKGEWRAALAAYQRAAALRPVSAKEVVIYGNNLLQNYSPYTRMARCHLELGELEAAGAQLRQAQVQHEPAKEMADLQRRLAEAKAAQAPIEAPTTPPLPKMPEPAVLAPVLPAQVVASAPVDAPSPAKPTAPVAISRRPPLPPRPSKQEQAPGPMVLKPAPASTPPRSAAPQAEPANPGRKWWLLLLLPVPLIALLWRRRTPPVSNDDFTEPDRLGPYRIERLLGRGGFASTYLAHHESTGQHVALKRLHPFRQDDAEFLGRFDQEAQLGSRLRHPNLVRLVDPGPASGQRWLAMEFVEGQRLDEWLKARGPLPVAEALALSRGIACGLAYAHDQGVVHRDLKPANIMLAPEGVKIMDFGISRVMDAETLTTTYAFLGTPRYAAPEAQLKTAIGPAADWYSFGIILFEMLAGHPPFTGETPFEMLDHHRANPLPNLRMLRPSLPEALVVLVEALCAKAPDQRPGNEEVLVRLAEIEG